MDARRPGMDAMGAHHDCQEPKLLRSESGRPMTTTMTMNAMDDEDDEDGRGETRTKRWRCTTMTMDETRDEAKTIRRRKQGRYQDDEEQTVMSEVVGGEHIHD